MQRHRMMGPTASKYNQFHYVSLADECALLLSKQADVFFVVVELNFLRFNSGSHSETGFTILRVPLFSMQLCQTAPVLLCYGRRGFPIYNCKLVITVGVYFGVLEAAFFLIFKNSCINVYVQV